MIPVSVSKDWSKLGTLNLIWVSVMSSYWMLQSSKLTTFTVSELLGDTLQVRINQRFNSGFIIQPTRKILLETYESFYIYKFKPNLLFRYNLRTKNKVTVKLLSVIRNQNFTWLL